MEPSILKSTKKVLQIGDDDESFDLDIMIHINSAFSILHQVGLGPYEGFTIEDESSKWEDFIDPGPILNLVKTYVYLQVRLQFDPPTAPPLLSSMEKLIEEHIFRLSVMREETDWVDPMPVPASLDDLFEGHVPVIDAGGA
jgi:hypothetical protein